MSAGSTIIILVIIGAFVAFAAVLAWVTTYASGEVGARSVEKARSRR